MKFITYIGITILFTILLQLNSLATDLKMEIAHEKKKTDLSIKENSNQSEKTSVILENNIADDDCTVSFKGTIEVKVVSITYECSATGADCTAATNDAFNCLTAIYSKVRRMIL
jgi:hypothetical protein